MKCLVLLCAFGLAAANPGLVGTLTSQYHAQDELGQYSYGYSGGPSAKHETRTADGVTKGGYSYVDAHGIVQSAAYVADSHNGFRVAATNLPAGPAVPAGPVHVAAAAPAVVAARTVVAAAPAVVAAPAAHSYVAAAAPAVVATPAVHSVVAAPSVLSAHALPGALYGSHGWSGLVHSLKKRSLLLPYTSYPGSTAPLVHGLAAHTVVAAPYATHVAAAPIAAPVAVAHGLPFGGPYHPHDTHAVSAARAAHLATQAVESVRNHVGADLPHVIDAQDTHAVAAAKVGHAAAVLEAKTRLHHLWKRYAAWPYSTLVASPLTTHVAAPLAISHGLPFGGPYHPHDTHAVSAARAAHLSTHAVESVRNHLGADLPHVIDAQDTHAVAAAKIGHAAAHLEARTRYAPHLWI